MLMGVSRKIQRIPRPVLEQGKAPLSDGNEERSIEGPARTREFLKTAVGLLQLEAHEAPTSTAEFWATFQDRAIEHCSGSPRSDGLAVPDAHNEERRSLLDWQLRVVSHVKNLSASEKMLQPGQGDCSSAREAALDFEEQAQLAQHMLERISRAVSVLELPQSQENPVLLRDFADKMVLDVSADMKQWLEQLSMLISLYHIFLLDAEGGRRRLLTLSEQQKREIEKLVRDRDEAKRRCDVAVDGARERDMNEKASQLLGKTPGVVEEKIYTQRDWEDKLEAWEREKVNPLLEEIQELQIQMDELKHGAKVASRPAKVARQPTQVVQSGLSEPDIVALTACIAGIRERSSDKGKEFEDALTELEVCVRQQSSSGLQAALESIKALPMEQQQEADTDNFPLDHDYLLRVLDCLTAVCNQLNLLEGRLRVQRGFGNLCSSLSWSRETMMRVLRSLRAKASKVQGWAKIRVLHNIAKIGGSQGILSVLSKGGLAKPTGGLRSSVLSPPQPVVMRHRQAGAQQDTDKADGEDGVALQPSVARSRIMPAGKGGWQSDVMADAAAAAVASRSAAAVASSDGAGSPAAASKSTAVAHPAPGQASPGTDARAVATTAAAVVGADPGSSGPERGPRLAASHQNSAVPLHPHESPPAVMVSHAARGVDPAAQWADGAECESADEVRLPRSDVEAASQQVSSSISGTGASPPRATQVGPPSRETSPRKQGGKGKKSKKKAAAADNAIVTQTPSNARDSSPVAAAIQTPCSVRDSSPVAAVMQTPAPSNVHGDSPVARRSLGSGFGAQLGSEHGSMHDVHFDDARHEIEQTNEEFFRASRTSLGGRSVHEFMSGAEQDEIYEHEHDDDHDLEWEPAPEIEEIQLPREPQAPQAPQAPRAPQAPQAPQALDLKVVPKARTRPAQTQTDPMKPATPPLPAGTPVEVEEQLRKLRAHLEAEAKRATEAAVAEVQRQLGLAQEELEGARAKLTKSEASREKLQAKIAELEALLESTPQGRKLLKELKAAGMGSVFGSFKVFNRLYDDALRRIDNQRASILALTGQVAGAASDAAVDFLRARRSNQAGSDADFFTPRATVADSPLQASSRRQTHGSVHHGLAFARHQSLPALPPDLSSIFPDKLSPRLEKLSASTRASTDHQSSVADVRHTVNQWASPESKSSVRRVLEQDELGSAGKKRGTILAAPATGWGSIWQQHEQRADTPPGAVGGPPAPLGKPFGITSPVALQSDFRGAESPLRRALAQNADDALPMPPRGPDVGQAKVMPLKGSLRTQESISGLRGVRMLPLK